MTETRAQAFKRLFPKEPKFRQAQIEEAVFSHDWNAWQEVTPLSQTIRGTIETEIPWLSYKDHLVQVHKSPSEDAFKAALELSDGACIETVLMTNKRGQWTVCLSTQVGCAMNCAFCATGQLGLKRNLNSDEIIDQYRFWLRYMKQMSLTNRISNLVLMGMGEPLANYENVKKAMNLILKYTDIGPTRITVSTVGMIPELNQILDDKNWPAIRLAVSLHSADPFTRKKLMPTSYDQFLDDLAEWSQKYQKRLGNRRHHVTFEYIMLAGENDDVNHAKQLVDFANRIGRVKINLIPYNATDAEFTGSDEATIDKFAAILRDAEIDVMRRRSLGTDINAACGQLAGKV
jgi:23S rRNA (adenine2503-C2)-methyltransferase